jgi:hypothetical protein
MTNVAGPRRRRMYREDCLDRRTSHPTIVAMNPWQLVSLVELFSVELKKETIRNTNKKKTYNKILPKRKSNAMV